MAQSADEREDRASDLAFTMIRVCAGGIVIPHGISQLMGGVQSMAVAALTQNGIEPSRKTAYLIILLELVGGICVLAGLFTRAFASALAIECSPSLCAAGGHGPWIDYSAMIDAISALLAHSLIRRYVRSRRKPTLGRRSGILVLTHCGLW
jgi:uncharacterized membrane protein YphA (DoxX/SURF4 family)